MSIQRIDSLAIHSSSEPPILYNVELQPDGSETLSVAFSESDHSRRLTLDPEFLELIDRSIAERKSRTEGIYQEK